MEDAIEEALIAVDWVEDMLAAMVELPVPVLLVTTEVAQDEGKPVCDALLWIMEVGSMEAIIVVDGVEEMLAVPVEPPVPELPAPAEVAQDEEGGIVSVEF